MGIFSNIVYKDGEIVDNSWIKWIHFGVPDEEGAERELKRRNLAAALHCLCCTVLSGCYFAASNKPEKHPNCDCGEKLFQNLKMKVEQLVTFESLQSIFLMKDTAIKVKINYLLY